MGDEMALVSLLRMGQSPAERAAFSFEHAMAHRTLFGAMSPLTRFSVLPYQLDPQQTNGLFRLYHQQAHWDMMANLPSYPPVTTETGALALASDQILQPQFAPDEWWTFANHIEHMDAMSTYPEADALVFPFW